MLLTAKGHPRRGKSSRLLVARRLPAKRPPTHPGEMLLEEFLRPLGISQSTFAVRLGVSLMDKTDAAASLPPCSSTAIVWASLDTRSASATRDGRQRFPLTLSSSPQRAYRVVRELSSMKVCKKVRRGCKKCRQYLQQSTACTYPIETMKTCENGIDLESIVVQKIVHGHERTIAITESSNEGACFCVQFP